MTGMDPIAPASVSESSQSYAAGRCLDCLLLIKSLGLCHSVKPTRPLVSCIIPRAFPCQVTRGLLHLYDHKLLPRRAHCRVRDSRRARLNTRCERGPKCHRRRRRQQSCLYARRPPIVSRLWRAARCACRQQLRLHRDPVGRPPLRHGMFTPPLPPPAASDVRPANQHGAPVARSCIDWQSP